MYYYRLGCCAKYNFFKPASLPSSISLSLVRSTTAMCTNRNAICSQTKPHPCLTQYIYTLSIPPSFMHVKYTCVCVCVCVYLCTCLVGFTPVSVKLELIAFCQVGSILTRTRGLLAHCFKLPPNPRHTHTCV